MAATTLQIKVGDRFGRLTTLSIAVERRTNHVCWLCLCDCSNTTVVQARCLRSGGSQSCGCLRVELSKARAIKHGSYGTPEYKAWCSMKRRCHMPTSNNFKNYGGRGIKVCERWCNSFEAFLADMGRRPSPKHSLDRIDNNGDYTPENCRWATSKEQARNRRDARLVDFNGETLPLKTWCERLSLRYETTRHRLNAGWSIPKAFNASP